tara:strand:+ start:4602 stop:5645 length:1044 start_codon:yes stop_codon:yes gene_type:complete
MFKKENVIFKTKGLCAYFSIVQDPITKISWLYYRSSYPRRNLLTMPTRYMTSEDGINFTKQPKEKDIILKEHGSCHNFFAFYDTNPNAATKFKGVGGTHYQPLDKHWIYNKRVRRHNRHHQDKMLEKYTKRPKSQGFIGLLAFESDEGGEWRQIFKDPIMNRYHAGFESRGKLKREFDSQSCLFWDKNMGHYKLYIRANLARGVRHVQYATSTDLWNWTALKSINFDIDYQESVARKINIYFPCLYPHPDGKRYLGILPYAKRDFAALRLVVSDDGVNWNKVKDFFESRPWYDPDRPSNPKNPCHPVNGYIISGDKIFFYIHHNYHHHNRNKPVSIRRYSMNIKDLP